MLYCNGMSGGPIVCGEYFLGVYLGSPPLPGQRELIQAAQLIKQNKVLEAYTLLLNSLAYDSQYNITMFGDLLSDYENQTDFLLLMLINKEEIPAELISLPQPTASEKTNK